MDKQEFGYRVDQIKKLYAKKDYKTISGIADKIEWKKVKSASLSTIVAEAYDYNGEYLKAKEILELAYERGPVTRNLLFRLSLSEVRVENIQAAIDFYKEFINTSPNDPNQYILKYEIAKLSNVSVKDQIKILEEFTSIEMDEQWKCELAKLYHEAGMDKKCVEICDEIILWFSDGEYVKKALELKKGHEPLSVSQQKKYDDIADCESIESESNTSKSDISEKETDDKNEINIDDDKNESESDYEEIDEKFAAGSMAEGVFMAENNDDQKAEIIPEELKEETESETANELDIEESEEEILAEPDIEEQEEEILAETDIEEQEEETLTEPDIKEQEEETLTEPDIEEAAEETLNESKAEEIEEELETEVKDITEELESDSESDITEETIEEFGETKELGDIPDYLLQVALVAEMKEAVDQFDSESEDDNLIEKVEIKDLESEYAETSINELDKLFYMENEEGQMSLKMEELLQTDEQIEGQMSITDLLDVYENKLEKEKEDAQILAQQAAEKLLLVQNAREAAERRVAEQRERNFEEAELSEDEQNPLETEENEEQIKTDEVVYAANHPFKLSEKQRELFHEHLISNNMETRICETIDKLIDRDDPESKYKGANLIITGDVKCGKTTLIINIIKVANKILGKKGRKIAKVKGRALNSKNIKDTLEKLNNTDIVIENASVLHKAKIEELIKAVNNSDGERLFVLEDTKVAMVKLVRNHPEIKSLFSINLHVDELSVKQWACFAKEYAKECGYEIEEMGMLALHVRIGEINKGETRLVTEDVKEIVDEAIDNAKRKGLGKLFSAFSKKDKNNGVKLLREQDFI